MLPDGYPPCQRYPVCGIFGVEDLCPPCKAAWLAKQKANGKPHKPAELKIYNPEGKRPKERKR